LSVLLPLCIPGESTHCLIVKIKAASRVNVILTRLELVCLTATPYSRAKCPWLVVRVQAETRVNGRLTVLVPIFLATTPYPKENYPWLVIRVHAETRMNSRLTGHVRFCLV